MSACLIMLTNTYPFDGGEYFIENEIDIVSRSFDKIMIFALDADSNARFTRRIPSNALAEITGKNSRKCERAGDLVNAAINAVFKRKNREMNIKALVPKRLFLEYFHARSVRQFEQVLEKLSTDGLKEYSKVIIYSYWLFVSADVAVKLKEHLLNMGIRVKKVVSRAHGYDIYEERNLIGYLPEREYLLQNLDAVYTCSKDGERYLKEKYPDFAEKINYSPLGTKYHGAVSLNKTDSFTVATCSSLRPVKRVWRVADALSLYGGKNTIKWIHIGGSGRKLEKLRRYTAKKLSGGKVIFEFKGQLPNDKVNDYYLNSPPDLFLNVSESEGVPVSVMEAASFGIPVLACDCGGTGEAVENGITGKLIPTDFSDIELMSEIEKFMLLSEFDIKRMSDAGRKMWEEKYNAKVNYSDFALKLLSDS